MVHGMDTDARSAARRYYSASSRSLPADMAALARVPGSVVIYTPRLVALLKPVLHHAPERWEHLHDTPEGADGWYVHLLVGDLRLARHIASSLPHLRWLCFRRGLRNPQPHLLPWHRILL